ncbi:flavin reductase family protein [Gephyromycinifex aptenodytis]|uniref:flavin reductase family protein n=1 Tax=Gephyromycinifex aptenodytis TaxID=2716227 RepID=UPI00144722FD|nr:flavin reductase family protein [Gephyromycinifex aptenodytis]
MSAAVSPHELRQAMSRFATGVAVITTSDGHNDHVMTANSLTSVSLDPPMVLLCIQRTARFHDVVLASGRWAANLLPEHAAAAAGWFATRGRAVEQQLEGIAHHRGVDGMALLEGAIATLECRTRDVHDGGDHSIFVADVLSTTAHEEASPLIYYRGGFRTLADPCL